MSWLGLALAAGALSGGAMGPALPSSLLPKKLKTPDPDDERRQDMAQDKRDRRAIKRLRDLGHTDHCAKRGVWGDGECECGVRDAR